MSGLYAVAIARTVQPPSIIGTGPRGEKGDPGGNVMAIGLFTDAGGLSIPVGTDAVRTAGHSISGLGIADYIADASVDSAYVAAHPHTSFISTNARGFRLDTSKGINLFQVGGSADSPGPGIGSDNYPAFLAATSALGRGGTLIIPDGGDYFFRCSQKVIFYSGIRVTGHGWHENPGIVNGVSYPIPRNYSGSIVCFDSDVGGFLFLNATDNAANAYANEFQSSAYSGIANVMLYGGGGTGTTAHGLEFRGPLFINNTRVENFAGNGVYGSGHTTGAPPYGLIDLSVLRSVHSGLNNLHGFLISGNDANVITLIGCNARLNGGFGYLDTGLLGNIYLGCHAATNNQSHPSSNPTAFSSAQRAYVLDTTDSGSGPTEVHGSAYLSDQLTGSYASNSIVAAHVLNGCYAESGEGNKYALLSPTLISGGNLASTGNAIDPGTAFLAQAWNGAEIRNVDRFTSSRNDGFDFEDVLKVHGVKVVSDRQTAPASPSGGTTVDAEARTAIGGILNVLIAHGLAG